MLAAQHVIPAIRDVNIGLRTTCTEARLFSGTSMCKERYSKDHSSDYVKTMTKRNIDVNMLRWKVSLSSNFLDMYVEDLPFQ